MALGLRCIGIAATLLCIAFVVWALSQKKEVLSGVLDSPDVVIAVLVSSMLWVFLNFQLGVGWYALVKAQKGRLTVRDSISISMRSQVAKYLPGNVFHFAGRVLLGRNAGLSTKICVIATTVESVFLALIAGLMGIPLLFDLPRAVTIGVGVFLVGATALGLVYRVRVSRRKSEEQSILAAFRGAKGFIGLALGAYTLVLGIQTCSFMIISGALSLDLGWGFFKELQIVSVTWLAGFVVVGSPGGLGVREAAFSVFAENSDVRTNLLIVASIMRVSSILGDVASLALGTLVARTGKSE